MRADRRMLARLVAFALALLPSALAAQALPPDPQIDQRIRSIVRPGEARDIDEEEAILTGRDDIVLMERRRFFTIHGSAGLVHSSNPALTPTDREPDTFANLDVGIRFATTLGNLVDVYAEAGGSTARYFEQTGLDYVAAYGSIGARVPVLGFDVEANYSPTITWDGDADVRQLTQHRIAGSIGRSFRLGRPLLRATIGGERIESDPATFRNSAATAAVSALIPINRNVAILASARGARRWYDNYFEGLLGLARRDWFAEASVGASFQLHRNVGIDFRTSYSKNWSTADISRYEAGTAALLVRAAFTF